MVCGSLGVSFIINGGKTLYMKNIIYDPKEITIREPDEFSELQTINDKLKTTFSKYHAPAYLFLFEDIFR